MQPKTYVMMKPTVITVTKAINTSSTPSRLQLSSILKLIAEQASNNKLKLCKARKWVWLREGSVMGGAPKPLRSQRPHLSVRFLNESCMQ